MKKRILSGIVLAAAVLSCVYFPAAAQEEQSAVWTQDFESGAITEASGAAALRAADDVFDTIKESPLANTRDAVVQEYGKTRYIQDFQAISETDVGSGGAEKTSGAVVTRTGRSKKDDCLTVTVNRKTSSQTYDGIWNISGNQLHLSKKTMGVSTNIAYYDLASFIPAAGDYEISFDIKPGLKQKGTNVIVALGANFSIEQNSVDTADASQCRIGYAVESTWTYSDKNYDFTGFRHVKLRVRRQTNGTPLIDFYLRNANGEDELVFADVPYRRAAAAAEVTRLELTVGKSLTGEFYFDNFCLTQAEVPAGTGHFLEMSKYTRNNPSFSFLNFSQKLGSAKSYTLAFDMRPSLVRGSANLALGVFLELTCSGPDTYSVSCKTGTESALKPLKDGLPMNEWTTVKFVVKDEKTADVYVGEELIAQDLLPRLKSEGSQMPYTDWKNFGIQRNNALIGALYFDNFELRAEANVGEPVILMNGAKDEKFAKGTLQVKLPVQAFQSTKSVRLLAVQRDASDGTLLQAAAADADITGSGQAETALEITEQEGTLVQVYAWDRASQRPLRPAITLEPYSETRLEKVQPAYPGYVSRAVTFSYDDGVVQDERLAALFEKYGMKATFNIVPGKVAAQQPNVLTAEQMKTVYRKHEVANHTYSHKPLFLMEGETAQDSKGGTLRGVSLETAVEEVEKGRQWILENLGISVQGLAWPNGTPDKRTDYKELQSVVQNGHFYTRWKDSGAFALPENWLEWDSTCHHRSMPQYTDRFLSMDNGGGLQCYFVWGHAYEFDQSGTAMDWEEMEGQLKRLAAEPEIWKASNGEIYTYCTAVTMLRQEGNTLKNLSDQDLYAYVNGQKLCIPAGESRQYGPGTDRPAIGCWGDSLTYGQGAAEQAKAYPETLAQLSGCPVYNMGVPGETAMTIAARQGAAEIVLPEAFTIPPAGSVEIPLADVVMDGKTVYYLPTADDGKVIPRNTALGGWNPVTICGVKGTLTVGVDSTVWPRMLSWARFTRAQAGAAVPVKAGERLRCPAQAVEADVNVFFTGTNGGWSVDNTVAEDNPAAAAELAALLRSQIAKTPNPEQYVVVGLIGGKEGDWNHTEQTLQAEFGEHYLDVKSYLASEQALQDAGLAPTGQDRADLAEGRVPASLRTDSVHLNDAGYKLLAQNIYKKLSDLKYIENKI